MPLSCGGGQKIEHELLLAHIFTSLKVSEGGKEFEKMDLLFPTCSMETFRTQSCQTYLNYIPEANTEASGIHILTGARVESHTCPWTRDRLVVLLIELKGPHTKAKGDVLIRRKSICQAGKRSEFP